jgi:hypothetical protein
MNKPISPALAFAAGIFYWCMAVQVWKGVIEPWDTAHYWAMSYPLSLVLASLLGLIYRRRAGLAGGLFVAAQWPLLVWASGLTPMLFFGSLIVALLALPAMALSHMVAVLRRRS